MPAARGSDNGHGSPAIVRIGRTPAYRSRLHPDVQLGGDLGAVRVADIRQPHGAEQNRIGVLQRLHRLIGKRHPGVSVSPGSTGEVPPDASDAADVRRESVEHLQGGRRHLDADSVSREHRDFKCARRCHAEIHLLSGP